MPGGQKSAGRRPKENNARRVKRNISKNGPGRRPRKEQRLEGKESRAAWPIKTFSVKETRPEGKKKCCQRHEVGPKSCC